jgi:hypothetical protein
MKTVKSIVLLALTITVAACKPNEGKNIGHDTPIDSTKVNGQAPATYGGYDPAHKPDSNYGNVHDTGTTAANTHNNGDSDSKK